MITDDKIKDVLLSSKSAGTIKVGFLLVPNFSMIAFSAAIEPLRVANRVAAESLFDWVIASPSNARITASNGVSVDAISDINELADCRLVFICSGIDVQDYVDQSILNAARKLDRQGAIVGAICTGTYVLAASGLLNDTRCTIHWENIDGLSEQFPHLEITNELFEINNNRITCSGGTASLDMMLYLISQIHGQSIAAQVSDQFIHDRIRDPSDRQRMELRSRLGVSHPKLLTVVGMMEANLEEPMSQTMLAKEAALSTRQLERLFRKYLSTTPTRYYLNLRLARARHLLRQTSLSILSVALACGFVSASHFSKCYRETYGKTPRTERAPE
ncbi:MAG: GlxA family transcriptional regulator [Candidatus Puniceispirillaceae bacterium]